MKLNRIALAPFALVMAALTMSSVAAKGPEILGGLIHEAEFQRLWTQNGDRWAEEDSARISKKHAN